MEKCAKLLVDESGNVKNIISQIPCTPDTITRYFEWNTPLLIGAGVAIVIVLLFVWFTVFYPRWSVWASRKSGEAELANAEKEQKIQIARAQSRKDAAVLNKEAAIIEAEAVSSQIEKIGKELQSHDLFLKWQWIDMMKHKPDGSVIYVPTEAGLPILEANRLQKPPVVIPTE